MTYFWAQVALAVLCGGAVGFSLGLIGGGGSILAVPLLLYLVGISDAHLAIGTSALAVAANAFANLLRTGAPAMSWRCAAIFAVAGIVGARRLHRGQGVQRPGPAVPVRPAMIAIAALMQRPAPPLAMGRRITAAIARLLAVGFGRRAVRLFRHRRRFSDRAGHHSAAAAILNAIGSSLLSVGMFGLTTAVNYALSGLIDWWIAALFIAGGIVGGILGMWSAMRLAKDRRMLTYIFAGVVFAVAVYMLARTGLPPFLSALLSTH